MDGPLWFSPINTLSATAVEPSSLIVLEGSTLLQVLSKHRDMGDLVMVNLASLIACIWGHPQTPAKGAPPLWTPLVPRAALPVRREARLRAGFGSTGGERGGRMCGSTKGKNVKEGR